jgi:hypothetical protein
VGRLRTDVQQAKLLSTHLPPIVAALEGVDFDWQIDVEEENPGLFRLVNYQNLVGNNVEDIVIPVLRRAYRLHTNWYISGLEDLSKGALSHVMGSCSITKPSPSPPSLESLMFEIEPGRVLPMRPDSGWLVVAEPQQTKKPKPGQLGWPDADGEDIR